MTESDRIAEEIRRAHDGDAWHGSSIREILEGVDARTAAARPIPSAHTIWELVLHMTGWAGEVRRRLGGAAPGLPPEGDWPEVRDTSPEAWEAARSALARAHEELGEAVRRFDERGWDARVGAERDAPLGTGVTFYQTLHGIVQHDAYHSGQISLLKKAAGSAR